MEKYKKVIEKNKSKISPQTWHEALDLSERWYSVYNIQDVLSISLKNIEKRLIILQ